MGVGIRIMNNKITYRLSGFWLYCLEMMILLGEHKKE